jgi:hypothetical protein
MQARGIPHKPFFQTSNQYARGARFRIIEQALGNCFAQSVWNPTGWCLEPSPPREYVSLGFEPRQFLRDGGSTT